MYAAIMQTPIGKLGLTLAQAVHESPVGDQMHCISGIHTLSDTTSLLAPKTTLTKRICTEIKRYFDNPTQVLSLPFDLSALTPFQQRVLTILQDIPVGETRTYGDIAKQLRSSPRAVRNVCRKNPIAIFIPCHRVVAQGHLGGYGGTTSGKPMGVKRWLLRHEGAIH